MTETPTSRSVGTPAATAEVLDEGALVLRWAPAGQDPVLFSHPGVEVRAGRPPHAGIPVCWPWFGPGPGPDSPSHGFARTAVWRHVATTTDAGTTTLEYALDQDLATSPDWPHPYALRLVATVGAELTVALTTTNPGDEPVTFGEALHAYLAVGDVREATVSGLDGAAYHDKVSGEDREQHGDLTLTGETDRVYRADTDVVVTDPVMGRRLVVSADGAADRVVWNPWSDKGEAIVDVAEAWPRFVCVEAANTGPDAVTVPPGGSHTLTYRLRVEAL